MFEVIREKIKAKLQANSKIQEVQDFPSQEFGGFPVAIVKSTRNEGAFETTKENERIYVFTVYLMQDIKSQGMHKARRIIEGVVDSVMDDFDQDQTLSGVSLQDALPADKTVLICYPVMTNLGTTDDEKYVVAEIEIKTKISINIS